MYLMSLFSGIFNKLMLFQIFEGIVAEENVGKIKKSKWNIAGRGVGLIEIK